MHSAHFSRLNSASIVGVAVTVLLVISDPAEAWLGNSLDGAETTPHVWIFSGQSNMQKIGGAAQEAVGKVVSKHGHAYESIYSAAPGKPIEAWLDPDHRDHSLWTNIETKVAEGKKRGAQFKGFVWYQGESDVNEHAGQYEGQLTELIRRVRKLTANERLPAVIVQIGAATSYSGRDWACGTVREAQRRVAAKDDRVALVTAIDAQLGDYTVHLSPQGSASVAARIAAAADRLAYGNANAYWGPQVSKVAFADNSRRNVLVTYDNVAESLRPEDGALAGFGASMKTRIPVTLADLEDATAMGSLLDDYVFASHVQVVSPNQILLTFSQGLSEDARLSYAAQRNAQYGPHRRWRLEFRGVTDATGHEASAFALISIDPPSREPAIKPPGIPAVAPPKPWKQIAINCVGRYPPGVNEPTAEIGPSADGLRQKYWNPASAGLVPNLFDSAGAVTSVGFDSSVWYMSPVSSDMPTPDHQMMYTWNAHSWNTISGLTPGESFDVVVYVDIPAETSSKTLVLLATAGEDYRPDGRSLREFERLKKETSDFRQIEVREPSGNAHNFQGKYILASRENNYTGNYLVFDRVKAGPDGCIYITTYAPRAWRDEGIRHKQYISGLQIRRRVAE